jgi:hypothetical protein
MAINNTENGFKAFCPFNRIEVFVNLGLPNKPSNFGTCKEDCSLRSLNNMSAGVLLRIVKGDKTEGRLILDKSILSCSIYEMVVGRRMMESQLQMCGGCGGAANGNFEGTDFCTGTFSTKGNGIESGNYDLYGALYYRHCEGFTKCAKASLVGIITGVKSNDGH